jgi:hypothetical protein
VSPAQIPTLSLSGYSAIPNSFLVEKIATRTGSSPALRTWCAPAGPAGKQTTSPGSRTRSPSGVRSVGLPAIVISHSSSVHSKWYGQIASPGGRS